MARWRCALCGVIYNPPTGDPENGVPPAPPSRKFLRIGPARSARRAKASLKSSKGRGNKGQTPRIMGDDAAPAKR